MNGYNNNPFSSNGMGVGMAPVNDMYQKGAVLFLTSVGKIDVVFAMFFLVVEVLELSLVKVFSLMVMSILVSVWTVMSFVIIMLMARHNYSEIPSPSPANNAFSSSSSSNNGGQDMKHQTYFACCKKRYFIVLLQVLVGMLFWIAVGRWNDDYTTYLNDHRYDKDLAIDSARYVLPVIHWMSLNVLLAVLSVAVAVVTMDWISHCPPDSTKKI